MRPRLRSMKRAGSAAGCDTKGVLEVCHLDPELPCHDLEVFPGPEPLQGIGDTRAAMTEDGLAKGSGGVSQDVGAPVLRQVNQAGIPVRGILDAVQVILDHLGEDALAVPDHNEVARAAGFRTVTNRLGVVVENLRAVGVQGSRSKRMLEADIFSQNLQCWTDSLQRDASLANGRQNHAFHQAHEGDDWAAPSIPVSKCGHDRLTGDLGSPRRRALVTECPGSEGRGRDIKRPGRSGQRVERNAESFVTSSHHYSASDAIIPLSALRSVTQWCDRVPPIPRLGQPGDLRSRTTWAAAGGGVTIAGWTWRRGSNGCLGWRLRSSWGQGRAGPAAAQGRGRGGGQAGGRAAPADGGGLGGEPGGAAAPGAGDRPDRGGRAAAAGAAPRAFGAAWRRAADGGRRAAGGDRAVARGGRRRAGGERPLAGGAPRCDRGDAAGRLGRRDRRGGGPRRDARRRGGRAPARAAGGSRAGGTGTPRQTGPPPRQARPRPTPRAGGGQAAARPATAGGPRGGQDGRQGS